MRLTAATIRNVTPPTGKSEHIFFDSELAGFGLRVRATGTNVWVVQYAVGGKTQRITLGSTSMLDITKARAAAKDVLAKVRLGGDPANEKKVARARSAETFGALLKPFLSHQSSKVRPTSLWANDYHLNRLCKPMHGLPIASVARRDVAARLTAILEAKGSATANRAHTSLSAFFSWCIGAGLLEANPASHTNKAPEIRTRDRLLSDDELMAIWHALTEIAHPWQGGRGTRRGLRSEVFEFNVIVKLLILTGLRKSEISDLCWSEIDLDAGLITVPGSRTKNKRPHLVPMSEPVRTMIEAQPREPDRELLFGGVSVRGFTAWSRLKGKLDAQITKMRGTPLAHWTLHDFRRKFSTDLHEKLGVPPHIVETLLGHVGHQSGVAGVYNKAAYLNECTRALDRWADHVIALPSEKPVKAKVVSLRTR